MVNEKYLLAAKKLAERNKNRLSTNYSLKEKETDELFYWIMSRLEWHVQGCWPAKKYHDLIIYITRGDKDEKVLLNHGRVSGYMSQYVKGEIFDDVIKDIVNIFNEIGKNEEEGYSFSAKYLEGTFVIHMVTEV
ncbi:MAG: hypothetical protein HFJ41_01200 [Clostridia bacterium]|nr:hypothetical protein [Clostridia bacterium]